MRIDTDELRTLAQRQIDALRYGAAGPAISWVQRCWRQISLITTAAILLVVLVIVRGGLFESREIIILHRWQPNLGTMVFDLDGEYVVRSMTIESVDQPIVRWRVMPDDSSQRISAFTLQQALQRLQVVRGDEGSTLQPGASYRMTIRASGATGHTEFTVPVVGQSSAGRGSDRDR